MCAVSNIGDYYNQIIPHQHPWIQQQGIGQQTFTITHTPTQAEFDALKKEVETMKQLLIKAKMYDEQTGQKDCEMEEKVALLKKVAELVGIDLKEVFGDKK